MAEAPACSSCWWLYWFYWDHTRHRGSHSPALLSTLWEQSGTEGGAGRGRAWVQGVLPITAGMVDLKINPSRNNSWRGRSLNRKEKPSEKCCGFTFSQNITKIMIHKDDFTGNGHFESLFARKEIPALTLDLTVNI